MGINTQQSLKAIILGLFALFFLKLHMTGDIGKYINPKYDFMSKIAIGFFLIFLLIQVPRIFQKRHAHHDCTNHCCHHHHEKWNVGKIISFAIVIFPIMTGLTFAPATLNSSLAANNGSILSQISYQKEEASLEELLNQNSESLTEKESIDIYSSDYEPLVNENYLTEEEIKSKHEKLQNAEIIEMDEDIFISYYSSINDNPSSFEGRTIKMKGFVFKEGDFTENQFVLSRFFITHCVADASVIGFLAELDGADQLQQDSWLEIEGGLAVANYHGMEIPKINVTNWKIIEEPEEPYIFPIQTWVE